MISPNFSWAAWWDWGGKKSLTSASSNRIWSTASIPSLWRLLINKVAATCGANSIPSIAARFSQVSFPWLILFSSFVHSRFLAAFRCLRVFSTTSRWAQQGVYPISKLPSCVLIATFQRFKAAFSSEEYIYYLSELLIMVFTFFGVV